ncbi:arginine N-succinyltransferase [Nibricoccus sp. IMCC34717]|uniref:arginine N-succinyltransferase n=1 Tax=Nibricoccus sp. IMCC34717 TaxID=3034021 RepID=UPI00384D3ECD
MFVFRPIADSDLPGLVRLARGIVGGLTSLPPNEAFLRERIEDSRRSFSPLVRKPGAEHYLFVLEDCETGRLVGTSGIAARVGGYDPFYSYEIRHERYTHAPLHVDRDIAVLHLKKEHRGPTEIGSLYLDPEYRRDGLGRLLSLARFLFIAAFPQRFDSTVIAEMRGYLDQRGRSPFWEAVGRHFFGHDYYDADIRSGLGDKAFIADLMPRHPIYVPLLAPEVQAVIGQVHHDTKPALALLKAEGFEPTSEIDIFDAGPQLRASVDTVRTIRERKTVAVRTGATQPTAAVHLLANGSLDFRACLCPFDPVGAALPASVHDALGSPEQVTYVSVR